MKSILITGGTGSFGNAFVSHLLKTPTYSRIVIYSRDEVKQAEMRERFNNDKRLRFFIGDVRDLPRLRRACQGVDVLVHAAALKRIEVGRYDPGEMIKTNVLGAMNIIEAATDNCVEKVVALSTDKAYQPISAYGQSKALAESLFLAGNDNTGAYGPRFSVTRYGNVSGSRGSIIPRWLKLLETTSTVPVTDPEATRFWMTIDEAVQLVLHTIEEMPLQVVVPKLPAYRVGDLADAMGVKMDIKGLPAYEKLHEGMADGNTSDVARRMTVAELRAGIEDICRSLHEHN